jgi:hypothetical protein
MACWLRSIFHTQRFAVRILRALYFLKRIAKIVKRKHLVGASEAVALFTGA